MRRSVLNFVGAGQKSGTPNLIALHTASAPDWVRFVITVASQASRTAERSIVELYSRTVDLAGAWSDMRLEDRPQIRRFCSNLATDQGAGGWLDLWRRIGHEMLAF
jgi:hypothetical protein